MKMTKPHGNARPLADWERDYIIENYGKLSFANIGKTLGVSHAYVREQCIKLGLHKPRRRQAPRGAINLKDVDKKLDFKLGETYSIKENSEYPVKEDLFAEFTRINGKRKFEGKLIDITKDLLVFDNGRYIECVRKVDFLTDDYEVIK
jgi:hypothetical protein